MKKRENGSGFHEVFGVKLRRVTAIIGRLQRYGLEEWQASLAVDFMMRELVLPLKNGWMSIDQLLETNLNTTRAAAMDESRKRNKAAQDLGRSVHDAIHSYYRCAQDPDVLERLAAIDPDLKPGTSSFQNWEKMFRVEMIGTERQVFSFTHGYAGTLDLEANLVLPAEDYGKDAPVRHMVVDFKTGQPDPVVIMQTAAYVVALEEMTQKTLDGAVVVYLNTAGLPKWKTYMRPELEPAFEMFLAIKRFCELEDAWRKKEPLGEPSNEDPPSPPSNPAGAPPAETKFDGSLNFD